jgi:hypothetical protein
MRPEIGNRKLEKAKIRNSEIQGPLEFMGSGFMFGRSAIPEKE